MHIYRWDLDKTYLDTDIESVGGLLRAAVETAQQKRTVPGSAALVRALQRHDPTAMLFVLSGSPTQMRRVLEEKLALDGVRVDRLVLKDNLGNLRRGRLRALTDQIGYKLPQLLFARRDAPVDATETLFGDDSEVDALIYAVYSGVVDGSVDGSTLARLLDAGEVETAVREEALRVAARLGRADAVEDIFIRVERGVALDRFALLRGRVCPVFSWLQAALVLERRGRLDRAGVVDVIRACIDEGPLTGVGLGGLMQDAVRRRLITADHGRAIAGEEALAPYRVEILRSIDRLNGILDPEPAPGPPDWRGFLDAR